MKKEQACNFKCKLLYYIISIKPNIYLLRSNRMQQYAVIYLLQNHSAFFGRLSHPSPGVYITVTAASGTATTFLQRGQQATLEEGCLLRYYDLYQRLQLQFYVLLMMGAMDTRNMQINFAVNKYCCILLDLKFRATMCGTMIIKYLFDVNYAYSDVFRL